MFSILQNLSANKRDPKKFTANFKIAVLHLEFCLELCEIQERAGRYYLLEQPASATSWKHQSMIRFLTQATGAILTTCDMCRFGLKAKGPDGSEILVKKMTRFLTNSPLLARELGLKCEGGHGHQRLLEGRAYKAQKYSPDL